MTARDIVVFERDERFTDTGRAELDFRLVRAALPDGACPLAICDRNGFAVVCGQWFGAAEVAAYAERTSGYRAEGDPTRAAS